MLGQRKARKDIDKRRSYLFDRGCVGDGGFFEEVVQTLEDLLLLG